MATKSTLKKIVDLAEEFVIEQKGVWGHGEWEGFLEKVGGLGLELSDETKRNLGNVLESCRYFYVVGATTRPKAKRKAKAKPTTETTEP